MDRHSVSSTLIVISNRDRADGKTGAANLPSSSYRLLTLRGLGLLQVGGVGFLRVITGPAVHRKFSRRAHSFDHYSIQVDQLKESQGHFVPVIRASILGQDRTDCSVC